MNTYKRHRFPPEIISYAVWLYYRFNLSHRDIEDLLAERGITISYETIRLWAIKFGAKYARRLKRKHRGYGDTLHIDEVFVKMNGNQHYLWRAWHSDSSLFMPQSLICSVWAGTLCQPITIGISGSVCFQSGAGRLLEARRSLVRVRPGEFVKTHRRLQLRQPGFQLLDLLFQLGLLFPGLIQGFLQQLGRRGLLGQPLLIVVQVQAG